MQSGNGRGVQQAEVSAAADALLAQGQRPTVDRVRRQLGRGSPNTVGPMLEAWFVGLAPRLGYPSSENGASNAPPAEIRHATDTLWHLALDMARMDAEAALRAEQDLLRAQQDQLGEERKALARESAALAERDTLRNTALARAQDQVDELALQLRDMQTALQLRDSELGSVRGSLARTVEAKDAAQREHQLSLQALTEERRRLEERFAANERRHLEEVDRARQEAKYSTKLLKESIEGHEASRQELEATQTKLRERIHSADIELATLRERMETSELLFVELRNATYAHEAQRVPKKRLREKAARKRGTALPNRA